MYQKTAISFLIISLLLSAFTAFAQPDNNALREELAKYNPTEKTIFYKLGDKTIIIRVLQYGEVKNIVCINLHSNETTSVQAAMSVLASKGGTLIKIENDNQRVINFGFRGIRYEFDPNRIFSRTGIEEALSEIGQINTAAIDEIEKFGQRILMLIPENTSCIIALHNNTDEAYSIKSYMAYGERQSDAKAVYVDCSQDEDDLALTTDSRLYQIMADNNYNSIWQDNRKARRDGSLSIYCGERKHRYINIETQHGKVEQYQQMLVKLLDAIARLKQKSLPSDGRDSQ